MLVEEEEEDKNEIRTLPEQSELELYFLTL